MVLPRMFSIALPNSLAILQSIGEEKYDAAFLYQYFGKVLIAGLQASYDHSNPYYAIALSEGLREKFGLSCLEGASKYSFVCKAYVDQFLEIFPMFDLAKNEEAIKETPALPVRDDFFELYEYMKGDYTI